MEACRVERAFTFNINQSIERVNRGKANTNIKITSAIAPLVVLSICISLGSVRLNFVIFLSFINFYQLLEYFSEIVTGCNSTLSDFIFQSVSVLKRGKS